MYGDEMEFTLIANHSVTRSVGETKAITSFNLPFISAFSRMHATRTFEMACQCDVHKPFTHMYTMGDIVLWQVFNERQLKSRKITENCMAIKIFCGIFFYHVAMRVSIHFFRIHFYFIVV